MSEVIQLSMVPDDEQICGTCRFWGQWEEGGDDHGTCRRHAPAPRPFSVDSDGDTFPEFTMGTEWPNTREADWCGEWQAKPNDPK